MPLTLEYLWRKRDPCAWSACWWKIGNLRWGRTRKKVTSYYRIQTSGPGGVMGRGYRNLWKSTRVVLEAAVFTANRSVHQRSPQSSFWIIFSLWKRHQCGNCQSMKPLMRAARLQSLQVQPCVRVISFQQASSILLMWKFLHPCRSPTVSLGQSLLRRRRCLPSSYLVFEMQKPYRQRSTSLLGHHHRSGPLWRNCSIYGYDKLPKQLFQRWRDRYNWQWPKLRRRSYHCWRSRLDWNHYYALQPWKAVEFITKQLNRAYVLNDCGSFSPPSKYDLRGS